MSVSKFDDVVMHEWRPKLWCYIASALLAVIFGALWMAVPIWVTTMLMGDPS